MNKLPVSINPCPIIEAIFEIRFESSLPDDAIFGIIYNQFKDEFQQVKQLPVLQLPAAIRTQDPNLKFTPHYKIKKDNFIIQIGPIVFSLVNLKDYCGWDNFSKKIYDTYNNLLELKLINKHYRTALRYINVFPDINVFNKSNLKILLNDDLLINPDQTVMLEQIDIIHKFASSILDNIKDIDPEFSKTVDENFWDLI